MLAFQLISSMIYLKSNCHNILDPKEFHVHLLISVAKKLNMLSIETISILGGGAGVALSCVITHLKYTYTCE